MENFSPFVKSEPCAETQCQNQAFNFFLPLDVFLSTQIRCLNSYYSAQNTNEECFFFVESAKLKDVSDLTLPVTSSFNVRLCFLVFLRKKKIRLEGTINKTGALDSDIFLLSKHLPELMPGLHSLHICTYIL